MAWPTLRDDMHGDTQTASTREWRPTQSLQSPTHTRPPHDFHHSALDATTAFKRTGRTPCEITSRPQLARGAVRGVPAVLLSRHKIGDGAVAEHQSNTRDHGHTNNTHTRTTHLVRRAWDKARRKALRDVSMGAAQAKGRFATRPRPPRGPSAPLPLQATRGSPVTVYHAPPTRETHCHTRRGTLPGRGGRSLWAYGRCYKYRQLHLTLGLGAMF